MRDNWGDFIDFEQAVLLRARVPSKRINNEDASMYKLIRKDRTCVQMVMRIKERHLQCCYTSGGIHPLVGVFEEIVKDKKRRLRTGKKTVYMIK